MQIVAAQPGVYVRESDRVNYHLVHLWCLTENGDIRAITSEDLAGMNLDVRLGKDLPADAPVYR